MKNILIILVIVGGAYLIFSKQDTWLGFYYSDGCIDCSDDYVYSPEFTTKDQCFDWAYELKDKRNNPNDLFECGRSCKLEDSGMYICKETVD